MNLNDILSPYNIALSEESLGKLDSFYELLIEWNKVMNLTAITERDEVTVKHFADSLIGLKYMSGSVCDVGAGAGFPSIPLIIANPSLKFTLIDSLAKRINFLNNVREKLGLSYTTLHMRAEDAGSKELRESFDTVTARAVASLSTLVEYLLPLVKVGGSAVIYKASDTEEEIKEAQKAITLLGGKLKSVDKYFFEGQGRSIIVIDKVAVTPKKYPRSGNKPRLNPIK